GERPAVRIEDREVIQAGGPRWRCRRPPARPRVEPDVMMVAARRQEHGVPSVATRYFEAQHVTVEAEGAVEIRHREVDVADSGVGVNAHQCTNAPEFHDATTSRCPPLCATPPTPPPPALPRLAPSPRPPARADPPPTPTRP